MIGGRCVTVTMVYERGVWTFTCSCGWWRTTTSAREGWAAVDGHVPRAPVVAPVEL